MKAILICLVSLISSQHALMTTTRYAYVPKNHKDLNISRAWPHRKNLFYIYFQGYVSTVQSKKYPVTGFQWHPEVFINSLVNLCLSFSPFAPRLNYHCGPLCYPIIYGILVYSLYKRKSSVQYSAEKCIRVGIIKNSTL